MSEWIEWGSPEAPKDKIVEIRLEDEFPIMAYFGGGADKAWRELNTSFQISGKKIAYRLSKANGDKDE